MAQIWKIFVLFVCLLGLIYRPVFAEQSTKIVRVAYVIAEGYQEGGEGEYKIGYGYEYLQKIASLNNWEYEYVYGSFRELLEKLKNGEVDLMGNLSYTDERAQYISFGSYEQGKENYYLYTLNNGDIDAVVAGIVAQNTQTTDWKVLMNYASSPYYFGVSKQRPDLLQELNDAQKAILEENPFYNEEVHNRYTKLGALSTLQLSEREMNWLLMAGNNGYRHGYPRGER